MVKWHWKNKTVEDIVESLKEMEMQPWNCFGFQCWASTSVLYGLFNAPSLICTFGTAVTLVYRCLLQGTKLYASPEDAITTIRLLMTGNTFHCLTSLVCNCIQRMEMETISCINWRHISTGDFSSWWGLCDDIGFVQLAWYGTLIRLETTCDGY